MKVARITPENKTGKKFNLLTARLKHVRVINSTEKKGTKPRRHFIALMRNTRGKFTTRKHVEEAKQTPPECLRQFSDEKHERDSFQRVYLIEGATLWK